MKKENYEEEKKSSTLKTIMIPIIVTIICAIIVGICVKFEINPLGFLMIFSSSV